VEGSAEVIQITRGSRQLFSVTEAIEIKISVHYVIAIDFLPARILILPLQSNRAWLGFHFLPKKENFGGKFGFFFEK
jgi:hypothetical protein